MGDFRDFQKAKDRGDENPFFEKDFEGWGVKKQELEKSTGIIKDRSKTYVNAGEIWWTYTGVNIGNEICGKEEYRRPVLVIKKVGKVFLVAPMTTHGDEKTHPEFYYSLLLPPTSKHDNSLIVLNQLKTMDKKRFINHEPYPMTPEILQSIKEKIRILYDL